MRKLILAFILFNLLNILNAQEFILHENGLIYNKKTMDRLKLIVDSLNLKNLNCVLTKAFYSEQQAKAHFIEIEGNKASEAKKDFDNNISFNDFEIKYPSAFIDHNLLVTRSKDEIYQKVEEVIFSTLPLGQEYGYNISINNDLSYLVKELKGKWVYEYYKEAEYSSESIKALYFLEEFHSQIIPKNYSEQIQYSDCIIDTNSQIYTDSAITRAEYIKEITKTKDSTKMDLFMSYLFKKTNKPDEDYDVNDSAASNKYYEDYNKWDSLKIGLIKKNFINNEEFWNLLNNALNEAIINGNSDDIFEEIVGEFISKEKSLELKRNRIVIGHCSMDDTPRDHAIRIALLSAETANWGVFIKSHLNIMNDRFERLSDGSYAWGKRQTYIKELEELNINVDALLIGSLFRIINPSKNHYFGTISRIGRALAEYSNKDALEDELINIIEDNKLDDFNRLIFYFVFKNYNYFIQDSSRKKINEIKFKKAINTLPEYLSIRISSKFYQIEQLLHKEINTIKKYFDILDASINTISSIDYDGSCWGALLHDKSIEDNLNFEITMDNDSTIGSIKPLLEKKDDLLNRVKKVEFLINHVNGNKNRKLVIRFVNDKSFSKKGQNSFKDDNVPKEIYNQYEKYLDESILVVLNNENGWSRWLIFPNGEIMLWHYSGK
ncbi:MAG: hypothetical protein ABSG15_15805, partial [FCB group bacterium]